MLTVVQDEARANEAGDGSGSLLDELARKGARQMLAVALQAEVAAYIQAHADQVEAGTAPGESHFAQLKS